MCTLCVKPSVGSGVKLVCKVIAEACPNPPLGNPEKIKFETPFRKIRNLWETECPRGCAKNFKLPPPFGVAAVLLCLIHSLVCVARGVWWCVGRVCAVVIMM